MMFILIFSCCIVALALLANVKNKDKKFPIIFSIVACDDNNGIARNGCIPWVRTQGDRMLMNNFLDVPKDKYVIVVLGPKTLDKCIRYLFQRPNIIPIIMSRNTVFTFNRLEKINERHGVILDNFSCLTTTITKMNEEHDISHVVIFGGSDIYNSVHSDVLIINRINGDFKCDRFIKINENEYPGKLLFFPSMVGNLTLELYHNSVYIPKFDKNDLPLP